MNIFTYGSLMYPVVWQRVVRGSYTSERATIAGFRRVAVRDEDYPMLVADSPAALVEGVVYRGVDAHDLQQLDAFEGAYYDRIVSGVVLVSGVVIEAQVYIANSIGLSHALPSPWDIGRFEAQGLARFSAEYAGYQRVT